MGMENNGTPQVTQMTEHALRQCAVRDFPVEAVLRVINKKLSAATRSFQSAAVFIGLVEDRGSLIGSNGECVWGIIRDGQVATVMLRRGSQPATPQALRVDTVFGPEHLNGK